VVNGHKSAAHTGSSDGGTGKTCLAEVCTVPVLIVVFCFTGPVQLWLPKLINCFFLQNVFYCVIVSQCYCSGHLICCVKCSFILDSDCFTGHHCEQRKAPVIKLLRRQF